MPNLNTATFKGAQKLMSMIGNPGQMLNPGIYKKVLPEENESGLSQYVVKLTSNDSSRVNVRGLLTENFSFSVDAQWETLDLVAGLSTNPFLAPLYKYGSMIGKVSGVADVGKTGISTRKIYTNSGYLELSIKFRVVDWKGTGAPVYSAFALSSMCLPKNLKNYTAKEAMQAVSDIAIRTVGNVVSLIPKTGNLVDAMTADLTNLSDAGINLAAMPLEGIQDIVPELRAVGDLFTSSQFLVLASAPSPITVKIGNYFEHNDMVVQSVKCDFSRQATSTGPLYVDFDVSISSRQALLLNVSGETNEQDLGLMVNGQKRVSYGEPQSVNFTPGAMIGNDIG